MDVGCAVCPAPRRSRYGSGKGGPPGLRCAGARPDGSLARRAESKALYKPRRKTVRSDLPAAPKTPAGLFQKSAEKVPQESGAIRPGERTLSRFQNFFEKVLDKRHSFGYYRGALRAPRPRGRTKYVERWLSWSKAHDWKSCNVSKAFWGSNPHLSAKNPECERVRDFSLLPLRASRFTHSRIWGSLASNAQQ